MWDVSLSLALNLVLRYSSPGNLAFFLLREALGQPERLGPNTIDSLLYTQKNTTVHCFFSSPIMTQTWPVPLNLKVECVIFLVFSCDHIYRCMVKFCGKINETGNFETWGENFKFVELWTQIHYIYQYKAAWFGGELWVNNVSYRYIIDYSDETTLLTIQMRQMRLETS